MEELVMQSAWFEVGLWETYQTGRGANASVGIAMIIAVWVAARFSSVAMEKGVNLFGKREGFSSLTPSQILKFSISPML